MPILYRTHWSDAEHDRPQDKISLHRNEHIDTVLYEEIEKKFLPQLSARVISQYPDIKGAYLALVDLLELPKEDVFLASGSEQAIRAVFYALSPIKNGLIGRNIAFPNPTFGLVDVYARLFKYSISKIDYEYRDDGFRLDYGEFNRLAPDVAYIASPDSPTGNAIDLPALDKLCQSGKAVIVDMAYIEYCNRSMGKISEYLALYKKYPNVYLIGSLSKSAAAAGLRIGYVISHADNIRLLYEDKPQFEINSIACEYLKFFSKNKCIFEKSVERIRNGKSLLENRLIDKKYRIVSTDGNFVLVEHDSALEELLFKRAKVSIINIDGHKFIRITAADPETISKIII